MKLRKKPVLFMLFVSGIILFIIFLMQPLSILHFGEDIIMLFPQGKVAIEERNLLLIIQAIMLLIVLPVYAMIFYFSWKYSAQNPKGEYDPDIIDNTLAEYIWWGVPFILTAIVAIITGIRTYQLDPFRPLSDEKPKVIQVVALQWKWLFIYPEEQIATVNYLQIPEKTPIHFEITADAPMNSFWIPSLGGQIYAMPNMKTELHLIADSAGEFRGSSANISGVGFASMNFLTRASSSEEYQQWIEKAKQSDHTLDLQAYNQLAEPGINPPIQIYKLGDAHLFHQILMKFMHPQNNAQTEQQHVR